MKLEPPAGYLLAFVQQDLVGQDLSLYGDPAGLRWLGETLLRVSNLDQTTLTDQQCPAGDSFHAHFSLGLRFPADIRRTLPRLTIGRIDEKRSGRRREAFPAETKSRRKKM